MDTEIPARLRWACRRGMLELDVLLGRYLEEVYLGLSEQDQNTFQELLSCNDQDLFNWLTGKDTQEEVKLADMIERIRLHAKNRH